MQKIFLVVAVGAALVAPSWIYSADPAREKNTTHALLVNGGHSPSTNYSIHEEELSVFYNDLFHRQALVLNAGGPGTPVLAVGSDGLVERNRLGLWGSVPSQWEGDTKTASLAELRNAFQGFATDPKPAVTLVFGDHGDENGTLLWRGETLNPATFHSLQTSIPEDTLVRSLFLHCHAGAMVVDPSRKRPTKEEEWEKYLQQHYRKNGCALALAGSDELADYLGAGRETASSWNRILADRSKPSLKSLRDILVDEKALRSTVKLSSDILAEDIFDFFCGRVGYASATASSASENHSPQNPRPSTLHASAEPGGCSSKAIKEEAARLDAEVERNQKLYLQGRSALTELGASYISVKLPKLHEQYLASQQLLEQALSRQALSGQVEAGNVAAVSMSAEEMKALAEAQKVADTYSRFLAQISHPDLDLPWVANESLHPSFQKYLEDPRSQDQFKELLSLKKEKEMKGKDLYQLVQAAENRSDRAQGDRKKNYRRKQGYRRAFVETLLKSRPDDPQLKVIREYYESIKACENSAIN